MPTETKVNFKIPHLLSHDCSPLLCTNSAGEKNKLTQNAQQNPVSIRAQEGRKHFSSIPSFAPNSIAELTIKRTFSCVTGGGAISARSATNKNTHPLYWKCISLPCKLFFFFTSFLRRWFLLSENFIYPRKTPSPNHLPRLPQEQLFDRSANSFGNRN